MTTTTRIDLFENTANLRGRHGVLHVFNPEGIGGLPSTFRWNLLHDCQHPAVALQRAASFTAATESTGMQDLAFWVGKATSALACPLHAAALAHRSMSKVYRWAHGIDDATPERILSAHPGAAEGWLGPIQEIRKPGRTADSIRMTVTRALAWLADPAVAAAYVHAGAAYAGSLEPHGRLDPPMLMALDEVTQICPVPLPLWMADSAGKGILIVAVCHGLAQLEARWHSSGARAIWDTAGIKVILGGVGDPDTLDRLPRLCGEIELRRHTRTRHDDGRRARTVIYQPVRVLPPELLRTLPEWRALVLRGNLSPVVVRLRMAWRRSDYRRARGIGVASRQSSSIPAVRPPQLPVAQPGGPNGADPLLAGRRSEDPAEPESQPSSPDELVAQHDARGPQQGSPWRRTPDTPRSLPPSKGPVSRRRRPWDPPSDSGDHS